jgi:hypothetical protein
MWINQPSKLQPYHKLHGVNVLADFNNMVGDKVTVYFIKGNTISQLINIWEKMLKNIIRLVIYLLI